MQSGDHSQTGDHPQAGDHSQAGDHPQAGDHSQVERGRARDDLAFRAPSSPLLWRHRWLFLGVFFFSQSLLAASYYFREAPWDERFAWRMFSPIRSVRCSIAVTERSAPGKRQDIAQVGPSAICPDGQPGCRQLRLSRAIHQVWIELLLRGRQSVAEAWVDARCAEQGGALFMRLSCPYPAARGRPSKEDLLFDGRRDLCAERLR